MLVAGQLWKPASTIFCGIGTLILPASGVSCPSQTLVFTPLLLLTEGKNLPLKPGLILVLLRSAISLAFWSQCLLEFCRDFGARTWVFHSGCKLESPHQSSKSEGQGKGLRNQYFLGVVPKMLLLCCQSWESLRMQERGGERKRQRERVKDRGKRGNLKKKLIFI